MTPNILVIYAHPYPRRSRAGRALLTKVADLPGLEFHSLYSLYPDFAIDVAREQASLRKADIIVWQTPIYWYGIPSLMKHWFEKVLLDGFAYGKGGDAVSNKPLQWVTTTGTALNDYRETGMHHHSFAAFVPPVEETARFCGMRWQPPIVVHDAHDISDEDLDAYAQAYRTRLEQLSSAVKVAAA